MVWKNPLEFNLQRFLIERSMQNQVGIENENLKLLAFGVGRHLYLEMTKGIWNVQSNISSLFHAFKWSLEPFFGSKRHVIRSNLPSFWSI